MVMKMRKMKLICLCAAVLLLCTMIPASGAMRVLSEKETINKLQNSSTFLEKQFIIGRISDLKIDDYDTSFIPENIFIIFYQKSSHFTGSYVGHIRDNNNHFYVSKDFESRAILTPHFICGFFRYERPETPQILFVQDDTARTLLVTSIDLADVLWSDIVNVGSGSCVLPTSDYVSAGDMITDCYGQIELLYQPSNTMLCYYEFTPMDPQIGFMIIQPGHTIHITYVIPSNVRWSDLQNIGFGWCYFPEKEFIEAGDEITDCYGSLQIHYIPTGTLLASYVFGPYVNLVQNDGEHSLTVVGIFPTDTLWSNVQNIGNGSCSLPSKMYIEAGDVITDCSGRITLQYIPTCDDLGTFNFF
jgi:hypothetical protein